MKKLLLYILFANALVLQSCNVNSDIIFHKDAATTFQMDIDMKDFMKAVKEMGSDSLMGEKKLNESLVKFPTVWTDFYEMEKLDGKTPTKNPDSIRLMKKMFMKSHQTPDKEFSGVSMKLDHFTKADYEAFRNSDLKNERIPLDESFSNWDGKTLVFNTENFSAEAFAKMMNESDEGEKMEPSMLQMMIQSYTINLNFENEIKTVKGKHDFIKQKDNKTIQIIFDLNPEADKSLKNKDKKIIITTE